MQTRVYIIANNRVCVLDDYMYVSASPWAVKKLLSQSRAYISVK